MANPRFDPQSLEPAPGRARSLPWVLLSVPFFFLLALVLAMVSRGDFGERLAKVGAIEREHTELYAIEKTPQSSVALLLSALAKDPAAWSASERWALEDLHQRAGLKFDAQQPLSAGALLERFRARWGSSGSPAPSAQPVEPAGDSAADSPR
jgi:hypothetical protein